MPSAITSAQAAAIKACLVHTIDTAQWALNGSPAPSTDPAGITLLPNGNLLISDSEIEEAPAYNLHGFNLYEADKAGTLLSTNSTLAYTQEPTGVGFNPSNGHLFFSDDDRHEVFELNPGPDGVVGTADDTVTSFSTATLDASSGGRFDPEGVAFGLGDLFLVSAGKPGGEGTTDVYQIDPGHNGIFDGLPPDGDDVMRNHFLTNTFNPGVPDPEGIAFNPPTAQVPTGSLYIIGRGRELIETTPSGTLLNTIDITPADLCFSSDVVQAPGSLNPAVQHLYIPDRGVDNGTDPYENDGKVYEVSLDPAECALLPQNLLLNPGFELDCNFHYNSPPSYPTRWSYSAGLNAAGISTVREVFTRSNTVVHSGKYAGKHFATDGSSYKATQTFAGLSGGTTYNFSGWVNIPATFTTPASFRLEVKWINSSNGQISITPITATPYTAATSGWEKVVAQLVAPAGTASAQLRMVVTSLYGTIYVDDFVFSPSLPPVIDGFTPASGPLGSEVILTGSHFLGTTAVTLSGVAATFTVDSDTQIRATVPNGATDGPISATTVVGTGVSGSAFTVTNPVTLLPAITSFLPSSGPVGTVVTLTGSHFAGATAVTVNGTPAITFTVDSDTQIQATVADGTTTGSISVTTPAGTGVSSSSFTVTVPPVITAFTPATGPIGSVVILTGSNFTGVTAVAFNGTTPASSFTVDSDTQISAIVPKVSAGVSTGGYIYVTSSQGTGVSPTQFVVTSPSLLVNYGFEFAANNINPDDWTLNSNFTRSNDLGFVHSGSFAGKHFSTAGANYTVSQTVDSLTAAATYKFSGWVNVPPASGKFTLALQVSWLRIDNRVISTTVIKKYTAATSGWDNAVASLVAPTGTTHADVQMVVQSLKRTIYVDDFVFKAPTPPTVASFSPSSGLVGTVVTLTGSDLMGATAVTFNGVAATYTVDSDNQIHATVPGGASTGPVGVTTALGTGVSVGDFTVTGLSLDSLLANPDFESALNGVNPDSWTLNSNFTSSSAVVHSGSFAGKHSSTAGANYTVSQTVNSLTAGTTYKFSGWVNVPAASGSFELALQVSWLRVDNRVISTTVIKKYTATTSGWNEAVANLVAPSGTTHADVQMVLKKLKRTVYVDDFAFRP